MHVALECRANLAPSGTNAKYLLTPAPTRGVIRAIGLFIRADSAYENVLFLSGRAGHY